MKFNYLVIIILLVIIGLIFYLKINSIKENFNNNEQISDNIELNKRIDFDIVRTYKNNKKDNLQEIINSINFDTAAIIKPPYIFENTEYFTNNDPKNSLYSPPVDCNSTLDCNSVILIENRLAKY
jgi:hypothetical protein